MAAAVTTHSLTRKNRAKPKFARIWDLREVGYAAVTYSFYTGRPLHTERW